MHLLIDNSNTRTKFAFDEEGQLSAWRGVIPTPDLSPDSLHTLLHPFPIEKITQITLCSVVPRAAQLITATLDAPTHQISHLSNLPISIAYPHPEQIGADRLANAAAAFLLFPGPSIVLDFGTAVTFDVISTHGAYLGGAIAPGTAVLRDYLHQKTALLPAIELAEPTSAIGKSTTEAMQIGAVIGYRGLIREIISAIQKELPQPPKILATGGDALLISQKLDLIDHLDPDLTLRGIQAIGNSNKQALHQ